MEGPEIFISYAWGGESEKIVNLVNDAFKSKGINLVRDKQDLGFKGMITDFMLKIGKGKAVVVVLSDKYLKSHFCMFELFEIYRNLDFKERIFPIVLEDANIFEPVPRMQYFNYWQAKKMELDKLIKDSGADAITVVGDEYKIYKKVFDNYGDLTNILKDINALTPEMHVSDNFNTLITAIEKQIKTDKAQNEIGVEPVDWKFIVRTLKEQKSILFLGPELFRNTDNTKSRQQEFFEKLANNNPGKILSYNQDNFFLFSSPEEKTRIIREVIDFFEDRSDESIVQKIAEIPFHIIVSINPDILLKRYFLQKNYPHNFEYFDRNYKKEISETPAIKKPLLYNLFGSVTKLETLILTHDELFEYFRAIMGNNLLPRELRTALESANDYIFLGFQFDKWYIQLILSLLKLNDKKYNFVRYASANTMDNETKSLCINHFRIEFIGPDNNAFINTLHEKCKEAGILRDFSTLSEELPTSEREKDLKQNIDRETKLLQEYEQILENETDPRRIYDLDDKVEEINKKIAQYEKELDLI